MKLLCVLFSTALLSLSVYADELDERIKKIEKLIVEHNAAFMCVASVPKAQHRDNQRAWPKSAVCIGDLIFDKGTLREKSGCTAFIFDANNSTTMPLIPGYGYNIVTGKKCEDGGFEAVMQDTLLTDMRSAVTRDPNTGMVTSFGKGKKIPVSTAFMSPYKLPDEDFDLVLVYSDKTKTEKMLGQKSKYDKWFETNRAAYLNAHKPK